MLYDSGGFPDFSILLAQILSVILGAVVIGFGHRVGYGENRPMTWWKI